MLSDWKFNSISIDRCVVESKAGRLTRYGYPENRNIKITLRRYKRRVVRKVGILLDEIIRE